jgi:hypothetical protein
MERVEESRCSDGKTLKCKTYNVDIHGPRVAVLHLDGVVASVYIARTSPFLVDLEIHLIFTLFRAILVAFDLGETKDDVVLFIHDGA